MESSNEKTIHLSKEQLENIKTIAESKGLWRGESMSGETRATIDGLATLITDKFNTIVKVIEELKIDNQKEHCLLNENQKHTNGSVKGLQIWKAGIATGVLIITSIGFFVIDNGIDLIKENRIESKQSIENITTRLINLENVLEDLELIQ